MDLKEFVENLEIAERVEYKNVADIGVFSIFNVKNIERKEFSDKDDPEKKYYKFLADYGQDKLIIPYLVLEKLKLFNKNGFTRFIVTRTGTGLGTKYHTSPIKEEE